MRLPAATHAVTARSQGGCVGGGHGGGAKREIAPPITGWTALLCMSPRADTTVQRWMAKRTVSYRQHRDAPRHHTRYTVGQNDHFPVNKQTCVISSELPRDRMTMRSVGLCTLYVPSCSQISWPLMPAPRWQYKALSEFITPLSHRICHKEI